MHTSIRQCVLFGKTFNGKIRNAKQILKSSLSTPSKRGKCPLLAGVQGVELKFRICFVFRASYFLSSIMFN
uniref:Uncharacterized protein n=1 Tax=Kuenenia stuttgartiensis TaxID=174633 RepID=Q1Q2F7_KUEST|nr:unknown protein [Candidatus Kuenenia stuttgartiensis]